MTTFIHIKPRTTYFPPRLEPAPMTSPPTVSQRWIPRTVSSFSDVERANLNQKVRLAAPPMSWLSKTASSALLQSLKGVTSAFRKDYMPLVTLLLISDPADATQIAEWFAETLQPDPKIICVELGEFTEVNHMLELTGWPPGYKGYGEATPLQAAIETTDLPVVLFKDLHLSSYAVQGVLRSYIEPSRPDGTPRLDLRRSVLIATGHYPLALVQDEAALDKDVSSHRWAVEKALKDWVADEGLLDRFGDIIKT